MLKSMAELTHKPFKVVKLKLLLGCGTGRGIDAAVYGVRVVDVKKAVRRALGQRHSGLCTRLRLRLRQHGTYLYGALRALPCAAALLCPSSV